MGRAEALRLLLAELPAEAVRRVLLALLESGDRLPLEKGDATGKAASRVQARTRSKASSRNLAATSPSVTPVKPAGRRRQHEAAPLSDATVAWSALRERVQASGVSPAELAAATGYAETTLRLALGRRTPPSASMRAKLSGWAEQQSAAAEAATAMAPFCAEPGEGRPAPSGNGAAART